MLPSKSPEEKAEFGRHESSQPSIRKRWKRSITLSYCGTLRFLSTFHLCTSGISRHKARRSLNERLQAPSQATAPNNVNLIIDFGFATLRHGTAPPLHVGSETREVCQDGETKIGCDGMGDRHGPGAPKRIGGNPPTFLSTLDYRLQRRSSVQTRAAAPPRNPQRSPWWPTLPTCSSPSDVGCRMRDRAGRGG